MTIARGHTTSEPIVARATPRGASALSVVRLSGDTSIEIAESVFEGKPLTKLASHSAAVGFLKSDEGVAVDQVVALVFRSPNSATGEDIVEFSCHGGDVASDEAVRLLIRAGARMAEPGEFTLRSFMNGKVDLAQAEAIGELIHARSTRSSRISLAHLRGDYSVELSSIRAGLLELLALIELELDFSEEDVEFADRKRLEALLYTASAKIKALLDSYRLGRAVSEGIRVVIAGRPNAGKSTLLNAIVGYDRVIVSDIPGTTRDEIEVAIPFNGIMYQFVDTAGIRRTTDAIEAEGVRRSEKSFGTADILLYLLDLSNPGHEKEFSYVESIREEMADLQVACIGNKLDLIGEGPDDDRLDLKVSAVGLTEDESGISELMRVLERMVVGSTALGEEEQVVTSQRHHAHLEGALDAARRAERQLKAGGSGDMLSSDVRSIIDHIGSITGEVTNEEILGQIFSSFCIGK